VNEIRVEEAYTKLVRPLSEKEYDDLRASIKTQGLLVPITVNQKGIILDGHNRYRICQELGIKPVVIRIASSEAKDEEETLSSNELGVSETGQARDIIAKKVGVYRQRHTTVARRFLRRELMQSRRKSKRGK
jgi:hypothetical protein